MRNVVWWWAHFRIFAYDQTKVMRDLKFYKKKYNELMKK